MNFALQENYEHHFGGPRDHAELQLTLTLWDVALCTRHAELQLTSHVVTYAFHGENELTSVIDDK